MRPDPLELFLELCAIPSPPGEERAVADRVLDVLRGLGLQPDEDDAGARIGSTAGNVYARLEPTAPGEPIFLCAHLDTVALDGPLRPSVENGLVRNAGGTILGADDKSALAAMIGAVGRVLDEGRPHAGIELLFTPKEEVGLRGADAFDASRLRARLGFVYDHASPIGDVVLGAPYSYSMEVRFHGRAAHAGMFPEEGRSAIAAAARAIADFRLGRLDDESSANVGTIAGGTAGNVVPEWCSFLTEARSHSETTLAELVSEMNDSIVFAANACECEAEIEAHKSFSGYRFSRGAGVVRLAKTALERVGVQPRFVLSGGGADANVFNERGLSCLNLANGMAEIHTPDEHIAADDLERMVDVTLALVDAARDGPDA
jgi:tripeptide aminopeptidase